MLGMLFHMTFKFNNFFFKVKGDVFFNQPEMTESNFKIIMYMKRDRDLQLILIINKRPKIIEIEKHAAMLRRSEAKYISKNYFIYRKKNILTQRVSLNCYYIN